jgi:hypothetical protein
LYCIPRNIHVIAMTMAAHLDATAKSELPRVSGRSRRMEGDEDEA